MRLTLLSHFLYNYLNYIIKQLLTFVEVDMLFLQTPKSNIDRGEAEVDITFWGLLKQHIDLNKS